MTDEQVDRMLAVLEHIGNKLDAIAEHIEGIEISLDRVVRVDRSTREAGYYFLATLDIGRE